MADTTKFTARDHPEDRARRLNTMQTDIASLQTASTTTTETVVDIDGGDAFRTGFADGELDGGTA